MESDPNPFDPPSEPPELSQPGSGPVEGDLPLVVRFRRFRRQPRRWARRCGCLGIFLWMAACVLAVAAEQLRGHQAAWIVDGINLVAIAAGIAGLLVILFGPQFWFWRRRRRR